MSLVDRRTDEHFYRVVVEPEIGKNIAMALQRYVGKVATEARLRTMNRVARVVVGRGMRKHGLVTPVFADVFIEDGMLKVVFGRKGIDKPGRPTRH